MIVTDDCRIHKTENKFIDNNTFDDIEIVSNYKDL